MNLTTTHPVAPEEIMALIDGELTADHAQAVGTHIEHCAECAGVMAEMRAVSLDLAQWTVADALAGWDASAQKPAEQVAGGGNSRKPAKTTRMSFSNWRLWAVGGVGALASVLILVLLLTVGSLRKASPVLEMNQLQRFVGAERHIPASSPPADGQPATDKESDLNYLDAPGGVVGGKTRDTTAAPPPMPAPQASVEVAESRSEMHFGQSGEKVIAAIPGKEKVINGGSSAAPMIARTVSLKILVKELAPSREALEAVMKRHGGYAANLTVLTDKPPVGLQASLRIPAPELAAVLGEIRGMGHVDEESQSGEEVTEQHADLVARLENSRETEQRLRDILAQRTGKIEDVLQVEEEIARVRGEIEGMEADQKELEHRVDFAMINLSLMEDYKEQLSGPNPSVSTQMRNAFVSGIRHAGDMVLGIVLFVEEIGPALLIWAVILGVPAYYLLRRYRKVRADL